LPTYTIPDVDYPGDISIDYHKTNIIEARTDEWSVISLDLNPLKIFPETNTIYKTKIQIRFPYSGATRYFTKNPLGLIDCRVNGWMARECTFA